MDAAALDALHRGAFGHAGAHGWGEADFRAALEDDAYSVATREQGFALARRVVDEAELMLIAVLPTARRSGVASALLSDLEAKLHAGGARRLMLEVSGSNEAALAFYRARGFAEVGLRPGYYGTGASPGHAALLFEKALKS
ncbi:MAG: GNAT family N-acetyltransferase [Pseudomonadota bacterium]